MRPNDPVVNGRHLRRDILQRFRDVEDYDHISFTVETRFDRYGLPYLQVYVTHVPNHQVYEDLCDYVLGEWWDENRRYARSLHSERVQTRGYRWSYAQNLRIQHVEVILGAFAL